MNKLYKVLYLLSAILLVIITLILSSKITIFGNLNNMTYILIIPVLYILMITYSLIVMLKNKNHISTLTDIILIILYYVFMIFLLMVCYLLNKDYSSEYMILSSTYYFMLLMIPDFMLRIYTILIYSNKSSKK